MKVIHLVENLDSRYGGPSRSVPFLSYYTRTLGINNKLYSVKKVHNSSNRLISDLGLEWVQFRQSIFFMDSLSIPMVKAIYVDMKRDKDLVLHVHNPWNFTPIIAYVFKVLYGIPYVISVRGSLYDWSIHQGYYKKQFALWIYYKRVLRNASVIHTTESGEFDAVERLLGKGSNIVTISNGVDYRNYLPGPCDSNSLKYKFGLDTDRKYILFMSRIHNKKGLKTLCEVFVQIANNQSDVDLIIAGPVEDEDYFAHCLEVLSNYRNRVHLRGMVESSERLELFKLSYLFCLPTNTENFGIVIAEALASGLPVVTTHGAPWRSIVENSCGFWVEKTQGSVKAAIVAMLSLSENEYLTMQRNAIQLARKYDWETIADTFTSLYQSISNDY